MATGEFYEVILNNLDREALVLLAQHKGFPPKHDLTILDLLKFEYETSYTPGGYKPIGKSAILQVPSRTRKGLKHAIYYDGDRVIDPSNSGFRYTTETGLKACEWVIEIQNFKNQIVK